MGKINLDTDKTGIEKLQKALVNVENPLWDGTIEPWVKEIKYEDGNLLLILQVPVPEKNSLFKKELEDMLRPVLDTFTGIKNIQINYITNISDGLLKYTGKTIDKVKNIIAIASNKGGVGKSTVAINLAAALHHIGARVAILDLDIYGPSLPTMIGIKGSIPEAATEIKLINKYGIDCMSFGFLIQDDQTPIVFRAPVVNNILLQFFNGIQWEDEDYLIIDLPPGTGDIQLTLAQEIPNTRLVMVTTASDMALSDVYKGIRMFTQEGLSLDVLGIIENMSYFECDQCHKKTYIFDQGGAKAVADSFGVEILGQIPIVTDLRISGDIGKPIVVENPDHPISKTFIGIAELLSARIAQRNDEMAKTKENKVVIDLDIA